MPSTYTRLLVHIVFATKDRAPTIDQRWRKDLHAYLGAAFNGCGAKTLIVDGVADHVHILVSIRSDQDVAGLVREIKKSSSAWAKQHYYKFGWQEGYAAFSVGYGEVPRVREYIANQEEHHKTRSSADELRDLLAEHGIELDERYFD